MGTTRDVYVVSAARTAIDTFGGTLKDSPPIDLATTAIKAAIARSGADAAQIGHVAMDTVIQTEARDADLGQVASAAAGAAAVVLASGDAVKRGNLKPMARLVGYAHTGVEPTIMGIGPVSATRAVLKRVGLKIADLDVIEANEAFAAQACAVSQELDLDPAKVNVNGSGISLGHPVGATGAIITTKALYELARTGGRYSLGTICIGGRQGIAAGFVRCCSKVDGLFSQPPRARP